MRSDALGGSGTIGTSSVLKTLTVNGTLAPGNSSGILTVNDNLDLNGNLSAEINRTTVGTLGAPIWFSVTTDSLTNATIRKISITNPGASNAATSFDPNDDTARNGAPDDIKWALGLSSLDDKPLPFLLKPHPTTLNKLFLRMRANP